MLIMTSLVFEMKKLVWKISHLSIVFIFHNSILCYLMIEFLTPSFQVRLIFCTKEKLVDMGLLFLKKMEKLRN